MSAFASKVQKTIPIPGLEGESATIRKLGWKALEASAAVVAAKGMEMVKTLGLAELQKTMANRGGESAIVAEAAADPFLQHDPMTLLERGIVSWSLSETVTAKYIEDLEQPVALALAREIYELSRPRTDAEIKNA